MLTPFSFRKESELFSESLLKLVQDSYRQNISQFISKENMQSYHHGRGWLTSRNNEIEESTIECINVNLTISQSSIVNNDIQSLFEFLDNLINGFTSQVISQMYKKVLEACDKSGNIINQSDYTSNAKAIIEMLKTIEFKVNENNQVELPQFHFGSGVDIKKLISELKQDSEFITEFERIKKDKSESAIDKEKVRLSKYKSTKI